VRRRQIDVTRRIGKTLPDSRRSPAWMAMAACRGMDDLFFPTRGDIAGIRQAREVCVPAARSERNASTSPSAIASTSASGAA
jgi:hypothetical protein